MTRGYRSNHTNIIISGIVPYNDTHRDPGSGYVLHDSDTDKYTEYVTLPSRSTKDNTMPESGSALAYVLVPLGALLFIAILSFLVVLILKKSK